MSHAPYARRFDTLTSSDVALVGGKNAALGELTRALTAQGIRVPDGFAVTAEAYRRLIAANSLAPALQSLLQEKDAGTRSLADTGRAIRTHILNASIPEPVADAVRAGYRDLARRLDDSTPAVAVRSSATAEDLPEASFAGQQDSFLNIRGEDALLDACRRCYASLFTDRAIVYRETHGYDHLEVALSIGVQQMVHANTGSAGVLFTLDPETGFPDVVVIQAAWGLGESIVKGRVTPDEYTVYTPFLENESLTPIIGHILGAKKERWIYASEGETRAVATTESERNARVLTDSDVLTLARWGAAIAEHFGRPMDVEWAKDGTTEELFIVQARPETVHARKPTAHLTAYRLKERGLELVTGQSVGHSIATGKVCLIHDPTRIHRFEDGAILVADSTDPDWVPIMKRAAGIVTNHGGRTSHAAIVSRELGLPALVGTGTATRVLRPGQPITLSCAEGDEGVVYDGILPYEVEELDLSDAPSTRTAIQINVASPAVALRWWQLPVQGVGLARIEYLINNVIRVHPLALTRFNDIPDPAVQADVERITRGYSQREDYFVENLARGIGTIAASRYPDPVIVRTSDFKTNEYAHLIGGESFEPAEANPMLGWRGASRYYSDDYRDGFALECRALKQVREAMGFTNVIVMIPFCRTPEEADRVLEEMAQHGLRRGENGLKVYVMAELPSNVRLADEFAARFDGFSIGSNDLTQLVLGVDRDSDRLAGLFDERHAAVKRTIRALIDAAHRAHRPVGICGQAPSDHPDFAAFLVDAGIDSISVLPDSVLRTIQAVAQQEAQRMGVKE